VNNLIRKTAGLILILGLVFSASPFIATSPVMADEPTTSVLITKYAEDGTTPIAQTVVTWEWMAANLPVQGDGMTHYYHQGPTFDDNDLWNPEEDNNVDSRDFGPCMGTDVKDLCELAEIGGAPEGSEIEIKSPDGFAKRFAYEDVYNPEPEQGKLVLTWYNPDYGFPPSYDTAMRLVFFAETTNSVGQHVFGNWDMHETLDEDYWHYYASGPDSWPSSSGLSVKNVSKINIYSSPSSPTLYRLVVDTEGDGETVPEAGGHYYDEGTVVDLEAIPDDGWEFVEWEGDVAASDDATTTVTMDDDKRVTAIFEEGEYQLTIRTEGSGHTTPSAGRHTYGADEDVELEAIPDDGWEFAGWEGDVADDGDATTTIIMDENKTVTALFAKVVYQLTINLNGQGNIIPEVGEHLYPENTKVGLRAIPETGWQFAGWTGDVADTTAEETSVTVDSDKSVTARFEEASAGTLPDSMLSGGEADTKLPPPAKTGSVDWNLVLYIIGGGVLLAVVILISLRVRRR
jgi:uncharacterized repeat protein (TIGR02543 family)